MRAIVTVVLCVVSFNILAVTERDTETLADETFDVWHRAGDDFIFYCKQPCAADDEAIQAYYMNFLGYLPELIDWHGVDVIKELKPVEMHLNESSVCPQQSGAVGYAKVGFHKIPKFRDRHCLEGPGHRFSVAAASGIGNNY